MTEIAANDRHRNIGADEIGFMYCPNETCMKNRGVRKGTLILYLHSETTPFVLEEGDRHETKLTKDRVHTWVNQSIAEFQLKWSNRTKTALD